MRNPFTRDLVLLHAPALYDFRTRRTFLGPVADAVPSTPIFEMYPVGLTSIAAFLERNHYNVEIINLAYRMLREPRFDVPAALRALSAPVFGIDLHWLPHVQGALAIAELVKRLHPASRVLMGGLSASYYHDELVRYPFVDFVLRGDSTEEPVRQLLQALREGRPLDARREPDLEASGRIGRRESAHVRAGRSRLRGRAGLSISPALGVQVPQPAQPVPCLEWLQYPTTMLLSARGCTQECAICGGSHSAYRADLPPRPAGVSLSREAGGRRAGDREFLARAHLHGARSAHGRP